MSTLRIADCFGNPATEAEWYAVYRDWLAVTEAKIVELTNALNTFNALPSGADNRWAIETLEDMLGKLNANLKRMQLEYTFAWQPQLTLTGIKWLEPCLVLRC